MRVDPSEVLLKTDGTTLVLERLPDGKIRVGSKAWDEKKVLLEGQALEIFRDGPFIMRVRQVRGPPSRRHGGPAQRRRRQDGSRGQPA